MAFCLLTTTAIAETTSSVLSVKGVVTDSSSNKPLSYVTVAIWDTKTKQAVKSTLTKEDGSFELKSTSGKWLFIFKSGYYERHF